MVMLMQGTPQSPARVVLVSSIVHHCCGRMRRHDMNFEQSYFSLRAYGHSKLAQVGRPLPPHLPLNFYGTNHAGLCCPELVAFEQSCGASIKRHAGLSECWGLSFCQQVLFAAELRRRLPHGSGVAVFACHPGECNTDIVRTLPKALQSLYHLIIPPFLITPERGVPPEPPLLAHT